MLRHAVKQLITSCMFSPFASLRFSSNSTVPKCTKSAFVAVPKKFCSSAKCASNTSALFAIYLDEVRNKIFRFYGEPAANVICSFTVDLFIPTETGRVLEHNLALPSFTKTGPTCRQMNISVMSSKLVLYT